MFERLLVFNLSALFVLNGLAALLFAYGQRTTWALAALCLCLCTVLGLRGRHSPRFPRLILIFTILLGLQYLMLSFMILKVWSRPEPLFISIYFLVSNTLGVALVGTKTNAA